MSGRTLPQEGCAKAREAILAQETGELFHAGSWGKRLVY